MSLSMSIPSKGVVPKGTSGQTCRVSGHSLKLVLDQVVVSEETEVVYSEEPVVAEVSPGYEGVKPDVELHPNERML